MVGLEEISELEKFGTYLGGLFIVSTGLVLTTMYVAIPLVKSGCELKFNRKRGNKDFKYIDILKSYYQPTFPFINQEKFFNCSLSGYYEETKDK